MKRALILGVATIVIAGCAGRRALVAPDASIRISRVVLFQNGLAYVERRGATERRDVELRARRDQVDDVLKSLTVVDHAAGGTKVASVRVLPAADDAATVTLAVGLAKAGSHDLSISYVAEMSGWRPTYRLVAGANGRIRLQGLAVIDNRSGEPWVDVDLALSTDVPLSFRYALQTPQPARRPQLSSDGRLLQKTAPSELSSSNPVSPSLLAAAVDNPGIQAAYAELNESLPQISSRAGVLLDNLDPANASPGPPEKTAPGQPAAAAPPPAVDPIQALDESEGLEGALLESAGGFNLGDGESGLVPFVDQAAEGSLVLLYKPATGGGPSSRHPYQAVLFRNPLDAPLLTGPVAVFTGDQFLGDGVTGTIPGGSHAFVAYALAPGVQVEQATERGEDDIRAVAVRGGQLRVELQATVETRFTVTSSRPLDQRLYLFVPRVAGYDPRQPPQGTIATPDGYYVPAPQGSQQRLTQTFALAQTRTNEVDISADPGHAYVPALIAMLGADGQTDVSRLTAIVDRVDELRVEAERWRADLDSQREALAERRRALESLRDVPANGDIRRRLAASVAQGVAAVDELTRRMVEANAELIALRQDWYEQLRDLTVDRGRPAAASPGVARRDASPTPTPRR